MANPFVTRLIQVQYGTRVLGGATSILLLDRYVQTLAYHPDRRQATVHFGCRFLVTEPAGSSAVASFVALCDAIESDLSTPRQTLTITISGNQIEQWTPSLATNFTGSNQKPTLRKLDDKRNGLLSRVYEFDVDLDTPATLAGLNGRLDSSVDLSVDEGSRRVCTVEGVYTALGTNTARAQYAASIGTATTGYIGTLLTGFGGTWELKNVPTARADDTNTHLYFRQVWLEVLENEGIGVLHDPQLTDQQFTFARRRVAPGDSPLGLTFATQVPLYSGGGAPAGGSGTSGNGPNANQTFGGYISVGIPPSGPSVTNGGLALRLQQLSIQYSVWVPDRTVDLPTKWLATIRPWLIQRSTTQCGIAQFAIVDEDPQFDNVNRRITATMTMLAPNGSNVLEQTVTVSDNGTSGIVLVAAWTSDPGAKWPFQGPSTTTRVVTMRLRSVGGPQTPPVSGLAPAGYFLLGRGVTNVPVLLGLPGTQLLTTDTTVSESYEYASQPTATGGGAAGGATQATGAGGPVAGGPS